MKDLRLTWPMYEKSLSIDQNLRHYKAVVQSQLIYRSETIFRVTQKNRVDNILKTERRITRTFINKKLVDSDTIYCGG